MVTTLKLGSFGISGQQWPRQHLGVYRYAHPHFLVISPVCLCNHILQRTTDLTLSICLSSLSAKALSLITFLWYTLCCRYACPSSVLSSGSCVSWHPDNGWISSKWCLRGHIICRFVSLWSKAVHWLLLLISKQARGALHFSVAGFQWHLQL